MKPVDSPQVKPGGGRLQQLAVWLDHRTGIETAVKNFLYENIPASSGWHQVLGSVAVFLFMLQAFTGVLLAFNYAPTPGDAYNSLRYIVTELTGGRLIRGLHHWGASMMIVVVVMHMLQVFLWGAYKRPREATWMAGVGLLLLTLAYLFNWFHARRRKLPLASSTEQQSSLHETVEEVDAVDVFEPVPAHHYSQRAINSGFNQSVSPDQDSEFYRGGFR